MRIGELARRTGVRTSALRYYEELRLLPRAPREHGKRVYSEAALDRVTFIQFAQACGFRLDEIAVLVGKAGERAPLSARWRRLAAAKFAEMDAAIARAERMKAFLSTALDCKCAEADACGRIMRTTAKPPRYSSSTPVATRKRDAML